MKQIPFLALLLSLSPVAHAADKIDLGTPEGAIIAMRKDQCSTQDAKEAVYTWQGDLYSLRRGEADKKLFRILGMNIRQCMTVDGGPRGIGFRQVSREIMLYLDPKTGAVVDEWENPWLNKTVKVLHVENDPVNFGPIFPRDDKGNPIMKWRGEIGPDGMWATRSTFPLFYHNPLQGDYQKYVGGAYHATEMFSSYGDIDDLTDASKDSAKIRGGWSRISEYLPWMEMQGREGLLYTHAISRKLSSYDELPATLKDYIKTRAPAYASAPPVDDKRPNETSWTVFKNSVSGEKLPRGGH
jgi:hypothetical protein